MFPITSKPAPEVRIILFVRIDLSCILFVSKIFRLKFNKGRNSLTRFSSRDSLSIMDADKLWAAYKYKTIYDQNLIDSFNETFELQFIVK